ncbi:MAG: tRNA pseudouridine(38-40) synthase TruA [Halanaeroarchaeum sp.]
MPPSRTAYRIAYDGRPFQGFQRQPDVPTVEDSIFDALRALSVFEGDRPPGYSAAGRTDAGVSAVEQTIALDAPEWLEPSVLNAELPDAVRAWAAASVSSDFHATHHPAWRAYRYHLYAPALDDGRVRTALESLAGEHDFHNLTPDDENTVRRLRGRVDRDDDYLLLTLRAGGFAREMVRRIVSLLRAVGAGDAPTAKVDRVLGTDPIDGPAGVPPAPAYPLVLWRVAYDADFRIDTDAAGATSDAFDRRAIEDRTRSRVGEAIASRIPDPR